LLNFVARITQASVPGVELNNLSLVPGEPADITILMMDVHFHIIPQIVDPPTPTPVPPTEEPVDPAETDAMDEAAATPTPTFEEPDAAE
jgi:hypothetical protein